MLWAVQQLTYGWCASLQVARLGEQLLQLRLEKGKVQREDMLLREKVRPPSAGNSTAATSVQT